MGVIGVDSSGIIKDPPETVWMAAVRKVEVQKHNILCLSPDECIKYRKMISDEWWRERIGAALIFKALRPLIKHSDIIQIHEDWKGKKRSAIVENYLLILFGKYYYGKSPLSKPKIQFISGDGTEDIRLADNKSWKARHKSIDNVFDCPDLTTLLEDLQ